jgi:hypothetical protein
MFVEKQPTRKKRSYVMNHQLSGLYQRICDYSPDECDSDFTFTQRLARDNAWNLKYTRRVVEEYKKFMFLAVAAGHEVTPSEQVDQAWHLHLIYTRSYWDDFCGQVLGRPIHHGPTKGGPTEQETFRDLYDRTKASYQRLLHETPPADIWPDAERRFGDDVHCVRVNTRQHWVVPKRHAQCYACAILAAVTLLAVTIQVLRDAGEQQSKRPLQYAAHGDRFHDFDWHSMHAARSVMWRPQIRSEANDRGDSESQLHPQPVRAGSNLLLWGLAIGGVVAVCVAMAALFNGNCSACGRARAMKKTGNFQRGTGWFATTKEEWKCIDCGATMWTTHYTGCGSSGAGASGCGGTTPCDGGDAGCGGSGCAGAGCGGGGCGGGGCGGS